MLARGKIHQKNPGEGLRILPTLYQKCTMLYEVVDARAPLATKALPFTSRKIPIHILILGKTDLAPKEGVRKWKNYLEHRYGIPCFLFSKPFPHTVVELRKFSEAIVKEKAPKRLFRAMVVGIPNVGKSTLLNALIGRHRVLTGDMPGITRGLHWVHFSPHILLLDTPGVYNPELPDTKKWVWASLGCLPEGEYDIVPAALQLLKFLQTSGQEVHWEILGVKKEWEPEEMLQGICEKFGLRKTGEEWDWKQAGKKVLTLFRKGKIGKVLLEEPSGEKEG
ncbi:MAG: YlqF/YawG family GTPase [bacterium JZ-2024 1]